MYEERKSLICIANPGGRESKIQRESKFSLSAVAKTIGSISVTGVNVQQALLAKCCSQSGAELQLSDAALPLEIRTHCLLFCCTSMGLLSADRIPALTSDVCSFHFSLCTQHHLFEWRSPCYSHYCFPTDATLNLTCPLTRAEFYLQNNATYHCTQCSVWK